ncbi:MAG TPA: YegP family protein [Bryobacteraceae bacterium]|nr:YegP family protein [Bryobacteraceae bacterium]HPT25202.1 YegP family protein [Bryobacteraceae bacterium]
MPGKFELKRAQDGQFYFNLKSSNGQNILTSEMYKSKPSALNGIESVTKNAPVAARYGKKVSASGKPFFVLKAGNNQVIGQSEMYETEKARDAGIESVKKNAVGAKTADLTEKA